MTSTPETLAVGSAIEGRWEITRSIEAGGMGSLYEVVHRGTGKRAALKVMKRELVGSLEMRQRFRQETMVTASIDSDYIVGVFDGGTDSASGLPYLVMELLRGRDLFSELAARGRLPPAEALVYLRQTALGLEKAHAEGVIHRDLKPENLFLTRREDGSPNIKIVDFGIAKIVAESMSAAETTRALGTPLYMAPEQVRGDKTIHTRADLYALAHVAFTLLVGAAYWAAEQARLDNVYPLLLAITGGAKLPASARANERGVSLPAGFDAWFQKATALEPSARFDDAPGLIAALAEVFEADESGPKTERGEPVEF